MGLARNRNHQGKYRCRKICAFANIKISPTMIRVRASQQTDLGQVIYANSITLTPGTISVDVANNEILVHALSENGARDLLGGKMDRRVSKMAGD